MRSAMAGRSSPGGDDGIDGADLDGALDGVDGVELGGQG